MADLRQLTAWQLVDRMWDSFVPAWLGGSFGLCLAGYSAFWRFAMKPWRLMIDYGDGHRVWRNLADDPLYHGPTPPEIPMIDEVVPLIGFIAGITILLVATGTWRSARRELIRRRRLNEARNG